MFFTIRKKYLQVGTVALLLLIVSMWTLASSTRLSAMSNNLDALSLSIWSHSTSKYTDRKSAFNKKVTKLFEWRKQYDKQGKFSRADTTITPDQTQLIIPEYYKEPDHNRTDVQPFDPRFTLGMYYNYIRRNSKKQKSIEAPFHWADWVDLSILNSHFFETDQNKRQCLILDNRVYENERAKPDVKERHALDPALFCVADKDLPEDFDDGNRLRMGFNVMKYFGQMEEKKVHMAGKAYLYAAAPLPASVVFLTQDGSYTVIPTKRQKLLHNGLVEDFMSESKSNELNTLKEFNRLKKQVPVSSGVNVDNYEIALKHEDFTFDAKLILKDLEERKATLNFRESSYLESLKYSIAVEKNPPKYFSEAKIIGHAMGDHYDWRFFNGLHHDDKVATLHRMVRVWLSFCRKHDITTWLAHGSLLAWYWNGIAFPWDDDIDVQVPIMSLHKLSMNFNQSLIVEDASYGFGRYFLDCGTFISLRTHGNGNNNIDARFIDIDTGFYIDITGLALTDEGSPKRYDSLLPRDFRKTHTPGEVNKMLQVYNCRNKHFSSFDELSPLVKSYVEGEVAYIPRRYSSILTAEYLKKSLVEKCFKNRFFVPQLRLWVHENDLRFFLRHREEWNSFYQVNATDVKKPHTDGGLAFLELEQILRFEDQDLLDLLAYDELLIDYVATRDLTSVHENEIMRHLFGKSTKSIIDGAPHFKPLKFEPFLEKLNQTLETFEMKVAKTQEMYRKYMDSTNNN